MRKGGEQRYGKETDKEENKENKKAILEICSQTGGVLKTLPEITTTIASGGLARSGSAMAMSVIMMIPPILVFWFTQSNVMETMSSSGIKE